MNTGNERSLAPTTTKRKKGKTGNAYKCEARELTRKRTTEIQNEDHEDHNAERGFNSMSLYNLVHKIIPLLQAMKIPDVKAAVDEEWNKLKNISSWQE